MKKNIVDIDEENPICPDCKSKLTKLVNSDFFCPSCGIALEKIEGTK